jgi:putative Ig domain-containing protein
MTEMKINNYLKFIAKQLLYLIPVMMLITSLSGGIAYAASGSYAASGVIGQTNYTNTSSGSTASQFSDPGATALDSVHHLLFVADYGNNRVQVFQLDNNNQLESSDAIYSLGASAPNAAGSGTVTQNGIWGPIALAYDPVNNRLFVEDYYRVLVFDLAGGISNDMLASYVLGQPNFTTDNSGTVTQSSLIDAYYGGGLAFDPTNDRLFVSDYYRIMVFNVAPSVLLTNGNGENASYVLGQPNFTTENDGCTQSEISYGYYDEAQIGLAFDSVNQRLFVADGYECSRVLVFNVAPSVLQTNGNGENASYVLGQPNFTSTTFNLSQNNTYSPSALGYDPNDNTLFVGDDYGNRILLFNVSPSTISSHENAYGILGQSDYSSYDTGTSQSEIGYSYYADSSIAVDPTNDQIFVPDGYNNNRILIYKFISITNGSNLANATLNSSYSQTFTTANNQGNVTFALTSGSLPPGLSLNTSTGTISGTPAKAGTYTFEITATDDNGMVGTFVDDPSYTITVNGDAALIASVSAPDTGFGTPQNSSSTSLIIGSAGVTMLGFGVRFIYRRRNTN